MVAERRRWTPAEDALLRHEVGLQRERCMPAPKAPTGHSHRIDWNAIAMKIPGRSNKDCRKRFHNQFAACGPWSPEEDARLRGLVRKYRCNWALIAQRMDTRTADQCSKRWHHSLNPELDRRPWTDAELIGKNQMLLSAVKVHGTTWKDIQRHYFPTRSANNIKNQFTVLSRRQRSLSSSHFSTRASSPVNFSSAQWIIDAATSEQDLCINQFLRALQEEEPLGAHNKEICNWGINAEGLGHEDSQEQIGNVLHPDSLLMDQSLQLCAGLNTELQSWTEEAPPLPNSVQGDFSPSHVQDTTPGSDSRLLAELPNDGSSRITITVDGAAPDTILTVMKILFESDARVEFQRGQVDA
ncbi:hypothetical protein BJX96DRAFT_176302 [Aspergillus floccosus]